VLGALGVVCDENPNVIMGMAFIDGVGPISVGPLAGSVASLTFQFVDVANLLPAVGPSVASVLYEADLTPDLVEDFTPIGISTDPASNFQIPWTIPASEAIVQALPLDDFGNLIQIPGDNGADDILR